MSKAIIVHGGAWDIPREVHQAHVLGCKNAAVEGWKVLQKGGSPLEAVVQAIVVMEDAPTFGAGVGSALNRDGVAELDAGIMDGRTLSAGAVAAVQGIRNPIVLARRVMDSEHLLLVSEGARRYAVELGIEQCSVGDLVTQRELERWQRLQQESNHDEREEFAPVARDTVGAVAVDDEGTVVVGTSTGGTPNKRPGRVGDSPLIGCGFYANRLGGASSTGWGESIMKVVLARAAVDLLAGDRHPEEAARLAIKLLKEEVDGLGGVIVLDHHGRVGFAYNTTHMARAYLHEGLAEPLAGI